MCCGQKTVDLADFLTDLSSKLEHLLSTDFIYENSFVKTVIDCFACDAPSRAHLINVKSYCGCFGCVTCITCKQEGEYVKGRMILPLTKAALRTDADFLAQTVEEHR
jgi:hypothetical protein